MQNPKKYTIVHTVYVGADMYMTEYKRVETDNIKKCLKDYDPWFVFNGWPTLVGED